MKIRIQFFAILKEITGKEWLIMEMDDGSTLNDLKKMLHEKYGKRFMVEKGIVFAVNGSIVKENVKLNNNDRVALLPPVSGGMR